MKRSRAGPKPEAAILDRTAVSSLRSAVERLRRGGLNSSEAAAEIMRQNFYEWIESERREGEPPGARLRIVKR